MNSRYIVIGIIQRGDEIILGKKAKGVPPYPDVWHTPGGGADDTGLAAKLYDKGAFNDEYFRSELKREMKEELGVEIANIRNIVPEYRQEPRQAETLNKHGEMTHYYFLEYLCDYAGGDLVPSDDLAEARWVKKSDLKNFSLTPPSIEMYKELGWLQVERA
jgi:ADP-ribose pyrophosphatase YjhB (NUDIX family)